MIRLKMFEALSLQVLMVLGLAGPSLASGPSTVTVVPTERIHGIERLEERLFLFGQAPAEDGACGHTQAFLECREADHVLWRRARDLFAAPGDLRPEHVIASTVRDALVAHGEIFLTGDALLGWLDQRGETVMVRGAFVVALAMDGTPRAERFLGTVPNGPPAEASDCASACDSLTTSEPTASSGQVLALTEGGFLVVGGWRRHQGIRQPVAWTLSRELAILRSKALPGLSPQLAAKAMQSQPGKEIRPHGMSGHVNVPTSFELESGLLVAGDTTSLARSDGDLLVVRGAPVNASVDRIALAVTIDIDPDAPILDDVRIEYTSEECSDLSVSIRGGFAESSFDLGTASVCPFDQPLLIFSVPPEVAAEMGFTAGGGAAGNAPLVVDLTVDLRTPAGAAFRAKGGSGSEGSLDQINSTTSYP